MLSLPWLIMSSKQLSAQTMNFITSFLKKMYVIVFSLLLLCIKMFTQITSLTYRKDARKVNIVQTTLKTISDYFVTVMASSLRQINFVMTNMEDIGIHTSELAKLDAWAKLVNSWLNAFLKKLIHWFYDFWAFSRCLNNHFAGGIKLYIEQTTCILLF